MLFINEIQQRNGQKVASFPSLAEIITDADYADDLVLLSNTSAQATSLLHNLEQAARVQMF